nr:MAG TPA: ASCH domain protein [Caudoviricetes sp.]
MMDLVIIILIIFWVILIADIILTFRDIRNNHKRFDKLIIKMKWDKPGRTTLKTNISFLNSELNILLHNEDASEEVIYSVDREISMLHRKLSLINNTNLVQKVGNNDFQRKTLRFNPELMDLLKTTEKRATIRKSDKGLKKGDVVKCVADDGSSKAYRKVKKIEQVKFKNLHYRHANREGHHHVKLLKQELKSRYPDMNDDTVLYQIIFELPKYL